jgi:sugar-specific transcriptional regulator TrmB
MDTQFLEDIGLTKTEAKVYLTTLDLGSALAGAISQKSGIHRRSVYDALERLIEKGLVSFITKNNRKLFEAAEPKRLLQIADERMQNLKGVVPHLELRHGAAKEKQEAVFFKGKPALKTVFDDQIAEKKTIYVVGASAEASDILQYYFTHYDKKRKSKRIPIKMIFPEDSRKSKMLKNVPLSEIKFLPQKYISPVGTNIYGDRVAIVVWTDEPAAILIKNKAIADAYRKYFNFMWERAKK